MDEMGLVVDDVVTAEADGGAVTQPTTEEQQEDPKKRVARWRERLESSRLTRDRLMRDVWRENVNYRVQMPYGSDAVGDGSARDKLAIPEDWSRTKQKVAQLMFQVPKILAAAGRPELEPVVPVVTAAINDVLTKELRASWVLDECLSDVVNAAGVMASVVGIDQRWKEVLVDGPPQMAGPAMMDPMTGQLVPPMMVPGPPVPVTRLVSQRFTLDRISPANLLWPSEFRGSDWDKAPWLGYETWMPKPIVKRTWQLDDEKAEQMKSSAVPDLLSKDIDSDLRVSPNTQDYVKVTIVWARTADFDDNETHPDALSRIVFVDGIEDPVEDGPTDWQTWVDEQPETPPSVDPMTGQQKPGSPAVPGHYMGITKNPIRVATLTYVSDLSIPPSDSEAGRPQIREMIKGRSQMIRQRDFSLPLRWFDVNRVDPLVADGLRAGTWQDMIPMQGPGGNAIGEVARASYPREDFEFQDIISKDLDRAWSLSNNQLGSSMTGRRSAEEIKTIQSNMDVRLDYEKARVSRFVVGVAEVLFGLMQQFMDQPRYVQIVGRQGAEVMTKVDKHMLAGEFAFDFLLDSSDRIDLDSRLRNVKELYNLAAQSPTINRMALEKEIITLHGLDPTKIMKEPPKPKEEPPNVNYSFKGEDLLNPMAVALLLKSQQITPKDIEAAVKMIQDAIGKIQTPQPLPQPPPGVGGPPPPGPPGGERILPPQAPDMITKRLNDGTRIG